MAKKNRMLENRGVLHKEEGDLVREHKAMHEENLLGSWLREDVERKAEEREKVNRESPRRRVQKLEEDFD